MHLSALTNSKHRPSTARRALAPPFLQAVYNVYYHQVRGLTTKEQTGAFFRQANGKSIVNYSALMTRFFKDAMNLHLTPTTIRKIATTWAKANLSPDDYAASLRTTSTQTASPRHTT